jgi:anthranilate phosphoribosyltransferase
MNIQQALARLLNREDLSNTEMQAVMRSIMQGDTSPAQIGGFLIALRMKGETIDEIAAAAIVMREFALKVEVSGEHVVDIVGTGGDGAHTFNISTTSAFVVAAAGGTVAKHNNRSVSSRSGSADVLEMAGVKLGLPAKQVAECINTVGVGFMFAPAHHSATKYAAGPRKELGVRTIFNMLGPLTNPAYAANMLVGVYAKELVLPDRKRSWLRRLLKS